MLRQKRRNGRLFDRSPAAIAHPGGGQSHPLRLSPRTGDAGQQATRLQLAQALSRLPPEPGLCLYTAIAGRPGTVWPIWSILEE